jgi:hypothetical protein
MAMPVAESSSLSYSANLIRCWFAPYDMGMLRAEHLIVDCQRALQQRPWVQDRRLQPLWGAHRSKLDRLVHDQILPGRH